MGTSEGGLHQIFANFILANWDRTPALLPGPSQRFSEYYSIEEFERRLTQSDIRHPQFQIVQHGRALSHRDYTRRRAIGSDFVEGLVDVAGVYRLWNEGATIILQSLHTCAPRLATFLVLLEQHLAHPVQANAYLTPADCQGFETHYDTHDVVVMQIKGAKYWRVWNKPRTRKPFRNEHGEKHVQPEGPLAIDQLLEQGSALYIPRGFYHDARASDRTSLHVTVGIQAYRNLDALNFVFQRILRDLAETGPDVWRDSLSLACSGARDVVFDALRDEVVTRVIDTWSSEPSRERFKEDRRPLNQSLLSNSDEIAKIKIDTRLRLNPQISPLVEYRRETIVLTYLGRVLVLPSKAESAVAFILERKRLAASELSDYTVETRLRLCRHLAREGLLQLEPQSVT